MCSYLYPKFLYECKLHDVKSFPLLCYFHNPYTLGSAVAVVVAVVVVVVVSVVVVIVVVVVVVVVLVVGLQTRSEIWHFAM